MKRYSVKQQAVFLTVINGSIRALGLGLRVIMSRLLGPETLGIIELAQSVHMMAIAPLTSGLPLAVSRLTAMSKPHDKLRALEAGKWLVKKVSVFFIPALWLVSPFIAQSIGDPRVLPSLWFTSICILILGYSSVYNGYSYGIERSLLPATGELLEQMIRCILTFFLLRYAAGLTTPWLASIPVFSTMVAEIAGLFFVMNFLKTDLLAPKPQMAYKKEVIRLSFPTTLTRLLQVLLRSLTSIIIPLRLQQSGLSSSEATQQLGMLNGMVMPFLMLPAIFTNALSTVSLPRIVAAEKKPSELRRLFLLSLFCAELVSVFCAIAVYWSAGFLAHFVYKQPLLVSLFKRCSPLIVLSPFNHLIASTLSALGKQGISFYIALITTLISLITTWFGAGNRYLRLDGVIYAHYASQIISLLAGSSILLINWKKCIKIGDKYV